MRSSYPQSFTPAVTPMVNFCNSHTFRFVGLQALVCTPVRYL